MLLPGKKYGDGRVRQQAVAFAGLNYTPGAYIGQWEKTWNVSSREYPALVPRPGREVRGTHEGATAMAVHDKMALVVGTKFYYDGTYIGEVSPGEKQIAVVGDWLVIWPDKMYYNRKDGTYASLELTLTLPEAVGLTAAGKKITIPKNSYVFHNTGAAGETVLSGRGEIEVLNPTALSPVTTTDEDGNATTTYEPKYLSGFRRGDKIHIDNYTHSVLTVTSSSREYWPGVNRDWVDIEYGRIGGWPSLGTVKGTVGGWAYAKTEGTGNVYDDDIHKYDSYTVAYDAATDALVWKKIYVSGRYLNEFKVGDIVAIDEANNRYEAIVHIDRTLYTDHYYYNAITTAVYEGTPVAFPTFTTLVTENAITTADKLRISAGNVSVTTQMQSYTDTEMNFADSVAKLNGLGEITIQRIAQPDLQYICAHEGRLWGVDGDTIYASKLGDPKVFETETTTQVDPWNTMVATDGEWTGIVSYSGTLLAFKEHVLHKIIGTLPENYQVYTYNVEGIKPGCHKSAVVIGEVLYYVGRGGVYAYGGNTPGLISGDFGVVRYADAVGGTDGRDYYLSARREDTGGYELLVLDTYNGIWLCEDDLRVGNFDFYDGDLYALDLDGGHVTKFGSGSETVTWSAVTGKMFEDSFNRKLYTRFIVRVDMDAGSVIRMEASHDGGEWIKIYEYTAGSDKTLEVPILPRRCDNFRLRISGRGFIRLRGIAREYREGSHRG